MPAIYSFVPSIGSINQNIFSLFLIFKSTVSSEIIGILGVNSLIFFVIISLTLRSPLLTGDLSDFILKEVDLQIRLTEVHIENFYHMDIKV